MVSKVWLRTICAKRIRCLDQEPSWVLMRLAAWDPTKEGRNKCPNDQERWWVLQESRFLRKGIAYQIWNTCIMLHEDSPRDPRTKKNKKPSVWYWWLVCSGKHGGPIFVRQPPENCVCVCDVCVCVCTWETEPLRGCGFIFKNFDVSQESEQNKHWARIKGFQRENKKQKQKTDRQTDRQTDR